MSRSSSSRFKIRMLNDKCPRAGEECPAVYQAMVRAVLHQLDGQRGGGLFGDIGNILKKACFAPCRRAHSYVKDAVEKIKGMSEDDFSESVNTRLGHVLTVGGMGIVLYGTGETAISRYVLSILKYLADSISFKRILENTVSSMYWTGEASGYTAKIIVGIALTKLAVDICLTLKKELLENQIKASEIVSEKGRSLVKNVFSYYIDGAKGKIEEIMARAGNTSRAAPNTSARNHGRTRELEYLLNTSNLTRSTRSKSKRTTRSKSRARR